MERENEMSHGASVDAIPPTERRNDASAHLDELEVLRVLELLNENDRIAVEAVSRVLPNLAVLVRETLVKVRSGGRVHYFGAGTPGRLAHLDAAELFPTFGAGTEIISAHIAGGSKALVEAVERAEDSYGDGYTEGLRLMDGDVAIGVSASGRTPYVDGALTAAREVGALTALVTSDPGSELAERVDIPIVADTGSEVLTGSTRLKAGTAQKIILNGFSTSLMIGLGRTYSNLMVSLVATNEKLVERSIRILDELNGASAEANSKRLREAGGDLKTAVVCVLSGCSVAEATRAIADRQGSVRDAVALLLDRQS